MGKGEGSSKDLRPEEPQWGGSSMQWGNWENLKARSAPSGGGLEINLHWELAWADPEVHHTMLQMGAERAWMIAATLKKSLGAWLEGQKWCPGTGLNSHPRKGAAECIWGNWCPAWPTGMSYFCYINCFCCNLWDRGTWYMKIQASLHIYKE